MWSKHLDQTFFQVRIKWMFSWRDSYISVIQAIKYKHTLICNVKLLIRETEVLSEHTMIILICFNLLGFFCDTTIVVFIFTRAAFISQLICSYSCIPLFCFFTIQMLLNLVAHFHSNPIRLGPFSHISAYYRALSPIRRTNYWRNK